MKTIRRGDYGSTVKLAQERLLAKGYSLPKCGADKDFGGETETAVVQFQVAHHLGDDGIVGDKTWDALMSTGQVEAPTDVLEEQRESLRALYQSQINRVPRAVRAAMERTLEASLADLGIKEVPDGSNTGPELSAIVGLYNQYWWVLKDGALPAVQARGYALPEDCAAPMPWCGMANSDWVRRGLELANWDVLGFANPLDGLPFGQFFGGPSPFEEWADAEGYPKILGTEMTVPRPGDIITMGRSGSGSDPSDVTGAGHIGMVIGQDEDDPSYVLTIEGNVSNSVASRRRLMSDMRWFVRWYKD